MQIALDAIDIPPTGPRTRIEEAALATMVASLGSDIGQVQPVIVITNGNRYALIDGRHRVAAARKLGWTEIWAEPAPRFDGDYASTAATVANAVREPLGSVELWRAMVALQANGRTLAAAAATLGIEERGARQLDKLGRLHPKVLELIETYGMPEAHYLRLIAGAPPATQAKAAAMKDVLKQSWRTNEKEVNWHKVAEACRQDTKRMSRAVAIFDIETAGIVWDQDWLAEPGSKEEFTTTNVKGFMAAQAAALEAQAVERRAKKQRIEVVEINDRDLDVKVPNGWKQVYGDVDKPKGNETVFTAIAPSGAVKRVVAIDTKAEKQKAKAKAERTAAKTATAGAGDDAPARAQPVADINPLSKAGRDAVARAKTTALQAMLRKPYGGQLIPWRNLCVQLILAVHATNVSVRGYNGRGGSSWGTTHGEDLVRQLVTLPGALDLPDDATLAGIARETLARVLQIDMPGQIGSSMHTGSGDVAEWIGNAINAGELLPRFDTEELLATANGETLRSAAGAAGIKPGKSVAELRRQLKGNAEKWRPPGAVFGAPGPKPLPVKRTRKSAEERDAA